MLNVEMLNIEMLNVEILNVKMLECQNHNWVGAIKNILVAATITCHLKENYQIGVYKMQCFLETCQTLT